MNNVSDHFDGRYFHNHEPGSHGLKPFLKWWFTRQPVRWPKYQETPPHPVKPPAEVRDGIHATYVNHATVLLQADGINVLTDPIWSLRCSPFQFYGPKRVRSPGIAYRDLPRIHQVLISHNHYDHFDWRTVQDLLRDHNPTFVMGLGLEKLARRAGLRKVHFLDWWQSSPPGEEKLEATFVPAQHFSGRGAFDRNRSLWGGFMLRTRAGSVFFSGDSGYGTHFREIRARLGRPALSLLQVGAYEPRWFMRLVHMNPEDAVRAHLDLESAQSMAIHFGTFPLSDEAVNGHEPDLAKALADLSVPPERFWLPEFGEGRRFGSLPKPDLRGNAYFRIEEMDQSRDQNDRY